MLKGVITDIDQTLINSRQMHEASLNHALEMNGFPKIREWVYGITSEDLLRLNFPRMNEETVAKVAYLKKMKLQNYFRLMKKVNGANELLRFIRDNNLKLCLVTNNSQNEITHLLKHLKWEKMFNATVGKEDGKPKPSPEPTITGLKKLQLHKNEVVYLGDANVDIESAHGAGVKVIISQAVHNTADADKADYVVASLKAAKKLIGELMKI
ncbi:MAG: HAD-IA family hydrolase [Candidatus Nanoarchaeia archaeon]|nr:HAD-IA family hydrolase [Candidatus Nanoarchaeia archaeon]MDD5239585.1 HAD-IA family hydrolase [Candidatus Nanoarchaeia archaeon]